MKSSLLLLSLTLTGFTVHAQVQGTTPMMQRDYGVAGANEYANLNDLTTNSPGVLMRKSSAIGSPYADNRWLTANVALASKQPLAPLLLKYDVLMHRLLMHKPYPSQDSTELNDSQVASFVLTEPELTAGSGRQRLFRRFEEGPATSQRDYVEVLHEGRYALLKHYRKEIKRASFQGMYSNGIPVDEVEDASVYYLHTPEGALTPVKLNLKAMQTAAPALSAALKTAAAARKPRTEADWTAIFNTADPAK